MEIRVVRLEDDLWHIRTGTGELPESEREELIEYLGKNKMNYRIIDGHVCIVGDLDKKSVFARMEAFYDGRADVLPF